MRFAFAIFVAVYGAIFGSGWIIGFDKYLYNNVLPPDKKTSYISVVHAWSGLAAGTGPLLAGWFLRYCEGLDKTILGLHFDQYTPMFIIYIFILTVGTFFVSRLKPDSGVTTTEFASMFLQPGQLSAMSTVFRYRFARDESDRVEKTTKMGTSSNPLNVEELIESLTDPSFNVRYEAVITIAKRKPNPKLTQALIDILLDPDPELASSAAWALGRIGHESAIPALREALAIPYPLLQARAARALGMLKDKGSAKMLLSWLKADVEAPLKRACAAALGSLDYKQALSEIFLLLKQTRRASYRGELAAAAARIIGSESRFIKLLKDCKADTNTATGKLLLDVKKSLTKMKFVDAMLAETIEETAKLFSEGDWQQAYKALGDVIKLLPKDGAGAETLEVLKDFAKQLSLGDELPVEMLALGLHTCDAIVSDQKTTKSKNQ